MPVRNESAYIQSSVQAVINQDYPRDRLEVVIADGMSRDGTRDEIRALQQQDARITLIDNPGLFAAAGLNRAMEAARGEIIVRVDGHCQIARDYVQRCVDHLLQGGVQGVGGPIETVGQTLVAGAIAAAMSSRFGVGGSAFRTIKGRSLVADTVPFPAYTRAAIDAAGPYDEELIRNQDDEYNYRLRKLGGKILLAADVHAQYTSRSTLAALARQYYQYGFWKVRVMQKHRRQMQPRQFVPALFVIALFLSLCLAAFWSWAAWLWGAVSGAYIAANVFASVTTASRTNWKYLAILPLAYAIVHVAYGVGFLTGLIWFANRWTNAEQLRRPQLAAPAGNSAA
jgi:glycosyltransferase involved in cell wall biosynthesis